MRHLHDPQTNIYAGIAYLKYLMNMHDTVKEALIRWQHPQRGLVFPGDFISAAEHNGLIVPVAVNLSSVQFAHSDVLQTVQGALARHGISAEHLELELTESVVMKNPEDAARTMQAFRECGLHLALDDFGTGYSPLAYLRKFPFDCVKIDKAFINDIARTPGDAAIASAVIAMAHRLDLKVVAEGVETEAQLRCLRQLECDQIQGYYFSRPVPAEQFAAMLVDGVCTARSKPVA